MADKQALDATFFAFRKREQSGVLLKASVAFGIGLLLIFAVFGAIAYALLGPFFTQLFTAMSSGDPSSMEAAAPEQLASLFWIFPLEIVFLFVLFLWTAAFEAACLRWMIRGESGGGLMGLKFDADMWRVYSTYWIWFGLLIAAYIVCAILLIGGGVGIAASAGDSGAGGLFALLMALAVIVGLIYFAVRLAPAAAASVARRRFSFFSAWKITSGRFWALFGAFLLLIIMNIVASIIMSTVLTTVLFAGVFANLDMTTAATNPEAFSQAYFQALASLWSNPASLAMLLVYYVAAGAVSLMFYVLSYGVNARAALVALEEGKIEVHTGED